MSQHRHTVLVLGADLFFAAKINEAAKQAGVETVYLRRDQTLKELILMFRPALIILNLDSTQLNPIAVLRELERAAEAERIPTLGYVAHVNTGVQATARQAGCDRILARSAFTRDLVKILASVA